MATKSFTLPNFICGVEDDSTGAYCAYEGDALYTINFINGQPEEAALVLCPACGVEGEDTSVVDSYLNGEL